MASFDLAADASALLLIDMQERFLVAIPAIAAEGAVGRACRILLSAARLLAVPTLISEQVPDRLGPTLPFLGEAAPAAPRLAKSHFSCADDPAIAARIDHFGRDRIVLCGIEAHICVLATAADLIARGRRVTVAGDAVASRDPHHRDLALSALRDLGALVVPAESIVFRWQRQAGGDRFKALSALVR